MFFESFDAYKWDPIRFWCRFVEKLLNAKFAFLLIEFEANYSSIKVHVFSRCFWTSDASDGVQWMKLDSLRSDEGVHWTFPLGVIYFPKRIYCMDPPPLARGGTFIYWTSVNPGGLDSSRLGKRRNLVYFLRFSDRSWTVWRKCKNAMVWAYRIYV